MNRYIIIIIIIIHACVVLYSQLNCSVGKDVSPDNMAVSCAHIITIVNSYELVV